MPLFCPRAVRGEVQLGVGRSPEWISEPTLVSFGLVADSQAYDQWSFVRYQMMHRPANSFVETERVDPNSLTARLDSYLTRPPPGVTQVPSWNGTRVRSALDQHN